MNGRLSLAEIKTRIATKVTGLTRAGTGYDRDYLVTFPKAYPAVWVLAQRFTPTDDGRGLSSQFRQHGTVEVPIRLVVQRYADGSIDAEDRLNELHNAVSAAVLAWQPTGADEPFVFKQATDGPASESIITADIVVACTATYTDP